MKFKLFINDIFIKNIKTGSKEAAEIVSAVMNRQIIDGNYLYVSFLNKHFSKYKFRTLKFYLYD